MFYMDGKALREFRCSQFLTQKQLAKMIGIDEATLCRYEKGKYNPHNKESKIKDAIVQYATCYDYLEKHVNDIDYYDRDEAEAERAQAFEESKIDRGFHV